MSSASSDSPLEFSGAGAFDAWLTAHAAVAPFAWLRIGKRGKDSGLISIEEAAETGLCHGWIDGQRKGLDDVSFRQRYSPRRPASPWSQVNVAKAEALIAAGRMRPGGRAEIERAQADGRWDAAYASQRTAEVPDDLAAALAANPLAAAAFGRMGRSARYTEVIMPLLKARSAAGRATVLTRVIAKLTS